MEKETIKVSCNIKPTEGQREAWKMAHDKSISKLVLVWSRQSGKSVFCELLLMEYLLKPNTFSAYVSPTFNLGRKVFKEIVRVLDQSNVIRKANASTLTIETVFGSTLQFFSVEAYTAIRGFTVSGVLILDEAAYFTETLPNGENIWSNVIMPTTKAKRPLVVMVSTPNGKSGFFYDFYLRAKSGEEGLGLLERNIYDDKLVDDDFIESIKKSISHLAFRQEFLCEFLDDALTFFIGFDRCFKQFEYQEARREWIGIDLSGDGQDETILTKINDLNQVIQYKIEGSLDTKYKKMSRLIDASSAIAIYAEDNGLGAPIINELKKICAKRSKIHPWTTTNNSKEEIISSLAVCIANQEINFSKNENELFQQFGTFICKISKTRKLTFGAKDGKHDDRIMSLAIALRCKEDNKNEAVIAFQRTGMRLIK